MVLFPLFSLYHGSLTWKRGRGHKVAVCLVVAASHYVKMTKIINYRIQPPKGIFFSNSSLSAGDFSKNADITLRFENAQSLLFYTRQANWMNTAIIIIIMPSFFISVLTRSIHCGQFPSLLFVFKQLAVLPPCGEKCSGNKGCASIVISPTTGLACILQCFQSSWYSIVKANFFSHSVIV